MNKHEAIKQVQRYQRLGLKVVAVNPDSKVQIEKGDKETITREVLKRIEEAPSEHVNLALYPTNWHLVIDIDVKNFAKGLESYRKLCRMFPTLGVTKTWKSRTPSSGLHYHYRVPANFHLQGRCLKEFPGIDFLHDNNHALCPPSTLGGRPYEWIVDPESCPLADLPSDVAEFLQKQPSLKLQLGLSVPELMRNMSKENGNRHNTLLQAIGSLLGTGSSPEEVISVLTTKAREEDCEDDLHRILADLWQKESAKRNLDNTSVASLHFTPDTTSAPITSTPISRGEGGSNETHLIRSGKYFSRPLPEAKWCIESVLPAEGVGLLAGFGRVGKSWVIMDMALEVSRGGKWLDRFQTQKRPIIYIDRENTYRLHRDRFERLARDKSMDLNQNDHLHFVEGGRISFDSIASQRELEAYLKELGPSLVLIDSFSKVFSGDENSMRDVVQITRPLLELAHSTGSFVLVIDHLGKSPASSNSATAIKGSVEKFNFGDTIILADSAKLHEIDLTIVKQRCMGDEELSIPLRIKDVGEDKSRVRLEVREQSSDISFDPDEKATEFICSRIKEVGRVSRQELLSACKAERISERSLDRIAKRLANEGVISIVSQVSSSSRKKNHHYVWGGASPQNSDISMEVAR